MKSFDLIEKGSGRENSDSLIPVQDQQVLIAGHNSVGLNDNRRGDEMVIVWISANSTNVRQRPENYAADLVQISVPSVDCRVVLVIGLSKARLA